MTVVNSNTANVHTAKSTASPTSSKTKLDDQQNRFFKSVSRQKRDPQHHNDPGQTSNKPIDIDTGIGNDTVIIGPGEDTVLPPKPEPPVAANEHGRIWSDPHFKGGDGGRFDIQGEAGKKYNLLSDSNLQLNGRFDKFKTEGTAVGKTGIRVEGAEGQASEITFDKYSRATINGQTMERDKTYTLADGGTAVLKGRTLTVETAEGYTIKQETKGWISKFINIDVRTGSKGVDHGRMPGGLLGQTFDADQRARNGKLGKGAQGEGAIDGKVQDYEMDGLLDLPRAKAPQDGSIRIKTGQGDDTVIIGAGDPNPEPKAPIAANEKGRIWGDPHFLGGDGGRYDVQGRAGRNYDLLTDTGLQLRGRFDGWKGGTTVVGETGMTIGTGAQSDFIRFKKDGSAQLNGQQMEDGKRYDLGDGGMASIAKGKLTVTTAEGYTFHQTAHGKGARAYINIDAHTGQDGVDNGRMPGGLLGQTFDADDKARNGKLGKGAQGEGAIQGHISNYERAALDPRKDASADHAFHQYKSELFTWKSFYHKYADTHNSTAYDLDSRIHRTTRAGVSEEHHQIEEEMEIQEKIKIDQARQLEASMEAEEDEHRLLELEQEHATETIKKTNKTA